MKKQIVISSVLLIFLWYFFVMFIYPNVPLDAMPCLSLRVFANMKMLASSGRPYEQIQNEIYKLTWKSSSNEYVTHLKKIKNSWELTAIPDHEWEYHHPIWRRVLFLNFSKVYFSKYKITHRNPQVKVFDKYTLKWE